VVSPRIAAGRWVKETGMFERVPTLVVEVDKRTSTYEIASREKRLRGTDGTVIFARDAADGTYVVVR
jgi:hypothetical protein